jgi:putative transposase
MHPGWGAGKRMSSTHLSLHIHVIFGTKDQRPLIEPAWRSRLHAYLGGAGKTLDIIPEAVGGVADHVHLLIGLRATKQFQWQDGYGAFTVSASLLETVKNYIAHQEEHHRKKTFQEEYVELLKLSGVEYDERYLW